MKNYIILSASDCTPFDNWYGWVKDNLDAKGFNVCVPYLPQGEFCSYKAWEKVMLSYYKVGMLTKQTTIICHDISCVFAVRFLVRNKIEVAGVVAISPFNTMLGIEQDELNKTFICKNDILEKVEKYVKFFHCLNSDNDPVVSDEANKTFCELTGAKVHEIKKAGHFNTESGYNSFEELISLIDNINKII